MPIGEPAQLGRALGTGSKQAVASTHPSTHTGRAQRPQSNASARNAGNFVRARGASSPRPNGAGASSLWGRDRPPAPVLGPSCPFRTDHSRSLFLSRRRFRAGAPLQVMHPTASGSRIAHCRPI